MPPLFPRPAEWKGQWGGHAGWGEEWPAAPWKGKSTGKKGKGNKSKDWEAGEGGGGEEAQLLEVRQVVFEEGGRCLPRGNQALGSRHFDPRWEARHGVLQSRDRRLPGLLKGLQNPEVPPVVISTSTPILPHSPFRS